MTALCNRLVMTLTQIMEETGLQPSALSTVRTTGSLTSCTPVLLKQVFCQPSLILTSIL